MSPENEVIHYVFVARDDFVPADALRDLKYCRGVRLRSHPSFARVGIGVNS